MAQAPTYNAKGDATAAMELPDAVFGVQAKPSVVHQVYTAERANAREPWADTKKRGEVRGGGRKPWQQKGTGRARHGSIRSPIWKGGGVTFGPLSTRSYAEKVNKKMSKGAARMCLSDKVRENLFAVVESFDTAGKTKSFADLRKKLPVPGASTLLIVSRRDDTVARSVRNLPRVAVRNAADVNVTDLLHHRVVLATVTAVEALEKRLKD